MHFKRNFGERKKKRRNLLAFTQVNQGGRNTSQVKIKVKESTQSFPGNEKKEHSKLAMQFLKAIVSHVTLYQPFLQSKSMILTSIPAITATCLLQIMSQTHFPFIFLSFFQWFFFLKTQFFSTSQTKIWAVYRLKPTQVNHGIEESNAATTSDRESFLCKHFYFSGLIYFLLMLEEHNSTYLLETLGSFGRSVYSHTRIFCGMLQNMGLSTGLRDVYFIIFLVSSSFQPFHLVGLLCTI